MNRKLARTYGNVCQRWRERCGDQIMTRIEASHATCVWRHGAHRYFKEGLAAGWIALTLLSVLSGDRMVALAQQPAENSHVGKRVITQPGTVLKVGNQVVDDEGLGKELARGKNQNVFRTYMVKQANGPWLWLVAEGSSAKGWAPAANVILFDQAIDYITGQIRANPGDWAKYVWRANVWLKRKELGTAIADYNEAIRLNPGSAGVAHQGRGRAWRAKKDYDKAIADYNEAIRLDPGYAQAYCNRGVAFLLTGSAKVGEDARKVLELEGWRGEYSQYAVLWGYFGLRRAGNADSAKRLLDDAAARCETTGWPYPVIRYLRGELDQTAMLAAASDNDKMTVARFYLGLDLALKGRYEEAREHYRWVKEHGNPSFFQFNHALAELDKLEGTGLSSAP